MNVKTKEIILKVIIVVGIISLGLIAIIYPLIGSFIPYNILTFMMNATLGLLMLSGFSLMVLVQFSGFSIAIKPIKAEKMSITILDNELFLKSISQSLETNGYQMYNSFPRIGNFDMNIYYRMRYWSLVCFVIAKVETLYEDQLNEVDLLYRDLLAEYYGKKRADRVAGLISIFCVEHENKLIDRYVNSNIVQEYQRFKLPVCVSFEKNLIYIAKQKDGLGISKYRQLRKELLHVLRNSE
jgi:hypothetical protein